jgi:hypothetical protein
MPVNDKQHIALLTIDANTQATIEGKLALGYVIQFIVDLQPLYAKLLIVYATPPEI